RARGVVVMGLDLRARRRGERGDEQEDEPHERAARLLGRVRAFACLSIRHKSSPARPESPFGILTCANGNEGVNGVSSRPLGLYPHVPLSVSTPALSGEGAFDHFPRVS